MSHKKYLSTEVSVHKLEVEFVDRFIEFEEALAELNYWLDNVPQSIRPEAQDQKFKLNRRFFSVMQAARLAHPQKRK